MSGGEDVGFVVIGRNEGERLRACLESVLRECRSVIYVDSASADESVKLARSLGVQVVELRSSDILTAASGRDAGFKALQVAFPQSRYVHFIDGDCLLQPGWLPTAYDFLGSHDDVAAVCGTRFEARPSASVYNAILNEEWKTPPGATDSCGGDSLMRVSALTQVGLFLPELKSCEEPELCSRLRAAGWKIWRLDVPMTQHDAAMTRLSQWWRRGSRAGFGYAQVWKTGRSSKERLYTRELASAFVWSAGVPLVALLTALVTRSLLPVAAALALYAMQVARMAAKRDIGDAFSWRRAMLILIGKFGAAAGAASFFLGAQRQQTSYR